MGARSKHWHADTADYLIDIPGAPPKVEWGLRVLGKCINTVAPWDELITAFPDDDRWRTPDQVLSPGFVDAHTHLTALIGHGATTLPWSEVLLRLDERIVKRLSKARSTTACAPGSQPLANA